MGSDSPDLCGGGGGRFGRGGSTWSTTPKASRGSPRFDKQWATNASRSIDKPTAASRILVAGYELFGVDWNPQTMNATAIPVFDEHILSTASTSGGTSLASKSTSAAVSMQGNEVAAAVLVHNIDSSATLTFQLQGSYDGSTWEVIGSSFTKNAFGYESVTFASVSHAFVRLSAEVGDVTKTALFSATLAFSEQ